MKNTFYAMIRRERRRLHAAKMGKRVPEPSHPGLCTIPAVARLMDSFKKPRRGGDEWEDGDDDFDYDVPARSGGQPHWGYEEEAEVEVKYGMAVDTEGYACPRGYGGQHGEFNQGSPLGKRPRAVVEAPGWPRSFMPPPVPLPHFSLAGGFSPHLSSPSSASPAHPIALVHQLVFTPEPVSLPIPQAPRQLFTLTPRAIVTAMPTSGAREEAGEEGGVWGPLPSPPSYPSPSPDTVPSPSLHPLPAPHSNLDFL